MENEEPMPTSVEDLPLECLVEILERLSAADISACACVCQAFREGATADCLWRSLCVRGQHGGALDFQEMLGCFSHADAQPLAPDAPPEPGAPPPARRHSSSSAAGKPWREVYKLSTNSLQNTICIDTGRGYAKYGMASAARPASIQICQPRAEATQVRGGVPSPLSPLPSPLFPPGRPASAPPRASTLTLTLTLTQHPYPIPNPNPDPNQDTLHQLAFRRLALKRCDLPNMAMIVAEPFRLAAASAAAERDSWRYATERRVLQGFQLKRLCIVDSASLCLFANKLTSGVVLNIGFGE